MPAASVLGVYAVEHEPCHLVELLVCDSSREFKLKEITQVAEGLERSNWQAAYDERFFDAECLNLIPVRMFEVPDRDRYRVAFFFHYLDLSKPLQTTFGSLSLPSPSSRPDHLRFLRYEAP